MQRALRGITVGSHYSGNAPQITVKPGEIFEVETELCTGDWLESLDTVWSREKENGVNPTTVVAVEGAMPGGSIRVHIRDIWPGHLGYTGFTGRDNPLANSIIDRDWGNNVRIVKIESGLVYFTPSLTLPASPMIGTFGTAPAGEPIPNTYGGRHGGNMDAQQVRAGAYVTLPVEVPGALLHIGDAHAIQGDGEICGSGGIECRATARLSVELVPRPADNACVRIENEDSITAVACEGDIENCSKIATRELLCWMRDSYGVDERDGYLLLGQVMRLNVTQLVNPTRTVAASVDKKYFIKANGR